MLGRLGRARLGQFLLSPEPGPQHSAEKKMESKKERMAELRRSKRNVRKGEERKLCGMSIKGGGGYILKKIGR